MHPTTDYFTNDTFIHMVIHTGSLSSACGHMFAMTDCSLLPPCKMCPCFSCIFHPCIYSEPLQRCLTVYVIHGENPNFYLLRNVPLTEIPKCMEQHLIAVKLRDFIPLLIITRNPLHMKGNLYTSCVRHAILDGNETWTAKDNDIMRLEHNTEKSMMRWMQNTGIPQKTIPYNWLFAKLTIIMNLSSLFCYTTYAPLEIQPLVQLVSCSWQIVCLCFL